MTVVACYVLLEYPVLSQTFVTDEIAAVRAAGAEVMTVSLEGGPGADVALATRRARSPWVLSRVARLLARRPRAFAALPRGPLTFGLRLKLLAAAEDARRRGVNAVHAHFAYRSADGAEVLARALGLPHSLTAHARDLFVPEGDLDRRLDAASRIVTVCDYNRRWLARHFPAAAAKTIVIPASTDVERPAGEPRVAHDPPVVLAVGRFVEKKGFDTLLAACARLRQPWRLVLIGDGPLAGDLRRQAEAAGIMSAVRFAGALDHRATLAEFAAADLVCGPFRIAADGDRDSMPVVIKEAMAAGLPVVATDIVGVPEMVVDGETGILVAPDDPAALAAALDALLADPGRRADMGARGRAVVEDRFDLRVQARRLLAEVFT